jgi:hypothetical protein
MDRKYILREDNNRRTKACKKFLSIGVILLLMSMSIIPLTSPMNSMKEKNNHTFIPVQKHTTSDTPILPYIDRTYFMGKIHNLTVNGTDYYFESVNIRKLGFWRFSIRSWGFSYDHYVGHYSCRWGGAEFHGTLKPTFICGYFTLLQHQEVSPVIHRGAME